MATQACERETFERLRNEVSAILHVVYACSSVVQVNAEALALRRNARIVDEIDVTLSFATLAHEMRFTRPVVTDS